MTHIKQFIFITLITLSGINTSNAQDLNHQSTQNLLNGFISTINNDFDKVKNAKGSPYISDIFEVVKLKRFGDKTFYGRYDANLGEMQLKLDNDTIVLNNAEKYEITFVMGKKIYKSYNYKNDDDILQQGFLVVLGETDSMAFLKEEVVKYYEEKPSTNGYDEAKPAEYKRSKDVFYYRSGDDITLLPQKRKDFLKLFPKNSEDLKEFIKENKISLKDDEDLITLFKHIKTL
ncbi:hypothetical protein [Winogradskyella undariae]|uniref:hypothetical protein n=1 Tax=Winogradskyella undariae TaxID=1285465 RepID=UPI0015C9972B|nr:hypothetical protein [Winogradskyella undariae]